MCHPLTSKAKSKQSTASSKLLFPWDVTTDFASDIDFSCTYEIE
jgi:hypothetical protein